MKQMGIISRKRRVLIGTIIPLLLIGMQLSGVVQGSKSRVTNLNIPSLDETILQDDMVKTAIEEISKNGFYLEKDNCKIVKLSRMTYWIYVPIKSVEENHLVGALSIVTKNNKVVECVWGYYDKSDGEVFLRDPNANVTLLCTSIHSSSGVHALAYVYFYWWGWKVVLSEEETQMLILILSAVGSNTAAIAAALAWLFGIPSGIAGAIAAFLAASAVDVAVIDAIGGHRGIYFIGFWFFPFVWCWHN